MKLHLGCGQRYLQGYVNIDYPPSAHTVQITSVADHHADIQSLQFPENSIEEVRLHHVFEHFSRPIACGLLAGWFSWLKVGGILRLEVPDFSRTALAAMNPIATRRSRMVAIRHLFGSHEAPWAVHREGYSSKSLSNLLQMFGFEIVETRKNHWKGTWNIEITSRKAGRSFGKGEFRSVAENYLGQYLVDQSEGRLLSIYLDTFNRQMEDTWAT